MAPSIIRPNPQADRGTLRARVAELEGKASGIRQVLMKWQAKVRSHYYEWEG